MLDFQNYLKTGVASYNEKYTLYIENDYKNNVKVTKIRVKSNFNLFNDINLMVGK